MTKRHPLVRLVSCALVAIVSVFSPFGSMSVHAESTQPLGPVVIGEVAWAGSSLSAADEWLELWNMSDATTSIGSWSLRGAGEGGRVIFFSPTSTIPAHGTFLISNYAAGDPKSTLTIPPNVVTTTVSLSNSALKIDLLDASGTTIDTAGDGKAPPAGSSDANKMTMVRDLLSNSWISSSGTPGVCDGCTIVPDETTTTDETVTTTEEIATSTTDVPIEIVEATTTEATTTDALISDATTTVEEIATATEATTTEAASVEEPEPDADVTTSTPSKPNYGMLRLNQVAPNPTSGKEWVEIVSLDESNRIPLDGCELHDASGRILTIHDVVIDPATSTHATIELPSARLNNDGDSVALYDPDGRPLDVMSFGKTAKGETWMRTPYGTWQSSLPAPLPVPQQIAEPALLELTTSTVVETAAPVIAKPTKPKTQPQAAAKKPAVVVTPTAPSIPPPKVTSAKTKTAPPKSKSIPITHLTFDMRTSDEYGNLRVQLRGVVGTQPGLLPNHSFILQAPDGRGLLVSAPTTRKLPPVGTALSVIGTLHFSGENIPSLKIGSKDGWVKQATSTEPVAPRLVDLTAPSVEDSWSLIEVTGTVTGVSGQTIHLDLDDAEANVVIRSVVSYRAKRLKPGDVIRVRGVIDTSTDVSRLFPRSADDITLVRHASKIDTQSASTSLPPWTPVGAAAGAVAAVEGGKELHRRKRQRDLEKKLTSLTVPSSA